MNDRKELTFQDAVLAELRAIRQEIAALIAERNALRTALRKNGVHSLSCPQSGRHAMEPTVPGGCNCGLSALLKRE